MLETYGNVKQITISERDVREEIIKNLNEWYLNWKLDEKHRKFWDKAIKQAVEDSKHDPSSHITFELLFANNKVLSRERKEAIRQVLQNELESSEDYMFWDANDSVELGYQPFYHWNDRRTRSSTLRIKREFKYYADKQLDPFRRFEGIEYSCQDWFRKIWKTPSLEGYLFEALVASHMIYNMPCDSCKVRQQLHWNGGIGKFGSWADVVCKHCMASYEIKSLKSHDTFEKKLKYNSFNGGSFRQFYKNEAQFKSRYLVLVSREGTYISSLQQIVHRVHLAKIQKVEPRLCPESFVDTGKRHIRMRSNIKIEKRSLEHDWFYVEPFNGATDIAREVFNDCYGNGAWSDTAFKRSEKSEDETAIESVPNDRVDIVDHLREQLREMMKKDDVDNCNWDTLYK